MKLTILESNGYSKELKIRATGSGNFEDFCLQPRGFKIQRGLRLPQLNANDGDTLRFYESTRSDSSFRAFRLERTDGEIQAKTTLLGEGILPFWVNEAVKLEVVLKPLDSIASFRPIPEGLRHTV